VYSNIATGAGPGMNHPYSAVGFKLGAQTKPIAAPLFRPIARYPARSTTATRRRCCAYIRPSVAQWFGFAKRLVHRAPGNHKASEVHTQRAGSNSRSAIIRCQFTNGQRQQRRRSTHADAALFSNVMPQFFGKKKSLPGVHTVCEACE
jgi:hypothetical protein